MTVEDYVEDQEIKLENKEEQLNQLKETLEAKGNEIEPKDRLKRTDGIVFDRDTDGQEQRLAERAQELLGKEAIAETASKLADKTRSNAREDLDGRDGL